MNNQSMGEVPMEPRFATVSQVDALQRLMESNPEYSRRVDGAAPCPSAAADILSALPPGVELSRKVGLGLWDGDDLLAFADVILGWPTESVAHIGLLVTDGVRHGEGLGRTMHDGVIEHLSRESAIRTLRLSIVDANAEFAEPFWTALGYEPTGEAVPYESGSVVSTARIWTRPALTV